MTELEKMQRAKMYLDKLANGIDPITDQPVSEGDSINQVRISRCLFYVSDVLRQVIENGGVVGKPEWVKKQAFTINHEELDGYVVSQTPIPVSEISRRINALVDPLAMTKLSYRSINAFMLKSGFLKEVTSGSGKTYRFPTEEGLSLGISSEERVGQSGAYHVTLYNADAQQFILDNIEAVIEINNRKKQQKGKIPGELNGSAWTSNYDEILIDLFQKNVPLSEIAVTLKRTEGGVRSRLKRLGLIESSGETD